MLVDMSTERPATPDVRPGERPACVSVSIAAPVEMVWAEVERPGHLERFHPFCDSNPTFSWTADDRRDRINYFSGLVLDRTFTSWSPPHSFRLDIGAPGAAPTTSVHWDFERRDNAGAGARTRVTITIHGAAHESRASLEEYLDSVLEGLRFVVEHGEPVTRNQFGPHPMFSPPHED